MLLIYNRLAYFIFGVNYCVRSKLFLLTIIDMLFGYCNYASESEPRLIFVILVTTVQVRI